MNGFLKPRSPLPQRKEPGTRWIEAWVGLRAGLYVSKERKISYSYRHSKPGSYLVKTKAVKKVPRLFHTFRSWLSFYELIKIQLLMLLIYNRATMIQPVILLATVWKFCLRTLYIYTLSNKYFVIISNSDRLEKQGYEPSLYTLVIDWNV
jgi:hypothetical protein